MRSYHYHFWAGKKFFCFDLVLRDESTTLWTNRKRYSLWRFLVYYSLEIGCWVYTILESRNK